MFVPFLQVSLMLKRVSPLTILIDNMFHNTRLTVFFMNYFIKLGYRAVFFFIYSIDIFNEPLKDIIAF